MTSLLRPSAPRPVRVLLDVVLRAGGLVAAAALVPRLTGETDGLALGLMTLTTLAVGAFALSLRDGLRQRDPLRLYLVWATVTLVVGLVETADYLRVLLTGRGAIPTLSQAWAFARPDLGGFLLMDAGLVGVPALVGIVLGVLVRPTRGQRRREDRPAATGGRAQAPLAGRIEA